MAHPSSGPSVTRAGVRLWGGGWGIAEQTQSLFSQDLKGRFSGRDSSSLVSNEDGHSGDRADDGSSRGPALGLQAVSQPGGAGAVPDVEYLSDMIHSGFSSPPPFTKLSLRSWGKAIRPGSLTFIGRTPRIILLLLKS